MDLAEQLVLSPDARHVAYAVARPQGQCVCLDGKEGKDYYRVDHLTFSPDGTRLAYWATTLTNVLVVVDGHEQRPFARGVGLLLFSPRQPPFGVRWRRGWTKGCGGR